MKKNTLKKVLLTSLVGVSALSLASCGGREKPTVDSTPVVPTSPTTPEPTVKPTPTPEPQHPFSPEYYAKGARSYVASSYEERTKILGILEKYAVDNKLTGLTLFGNGGQVLYSPDIQKGTSNYIPGYGFGILSEGQITKDLEKETKTEWKRYLHTFESEDPRTINYMNDKGSVVSDLNSNVSGSLFTQFMNEDKDGYEWGAGAFAKSDRPIAQNADENGLATIYRVEVKVGDELKYTTNSKDSKLSKYNNRPVAAEDYLTSYAILLTRKYGMARGADNLDKAGSLKGTKEYFEGSETGFNAELFKKLGVHFVKEGGKNYLEYEFNIPCNTFYAMYYLAGSLTTPVPGDFIKDLGNGNFEEGVKAFGNFTDTGLTPVDTFLSTGPYALETWEADKQIVMKKNPNYKEGSPARRGRYNIAGIHYQILKAIGSDPHAAIKEFEAGKIHQAGVPSDMLDKYASDPRKTTTSDSSTFKMNVNTCDEAMWEQLFGVAGSITQTPKDKYWKVEPAMANKSFVDGLNYAINRNELAAKLGRTPSANYFASTYLSDPENGIAYNSTEEHKNAVKEIQEGTDNGYSLELAKASFKKASDELIAAGKYKKGDTINIEIAWMYPQDEQELHNPLKKYFEDAFNASGSDLKLHIDFWVGSEWDRVYHDKLMCGQFDLGFGSISGNSLNPINFLEVLKSDNSSGFTLNWGVDTNKVSKDIYYDGMYWSFDALWEAADKGGYFENGVVSPVFTANPVASSVTKNADGTYTVVAETNINVAEGVKFEFNGVILFGQSDTMEYTESPVAKENYKFSADKKKLTITLTAAQYEQFKGATRLGVDLLATVEIKKVSTNLVNSVYFAFPAE